MTAKTAHEQLRTIAETGKQYLAYEVNPDTEDDVVVARGYDFTRTLRVPTKTGNGHVVARATLRLMSHPPMTEDEPEGLVVVQARLDWGPKNVPHRSQGEAAFTGRGAEGLDTEGDQHGLNRREFAADWFQSFPGGLLTLDGLKRPPAEPGSPDAVNANWHEAIHRDVVLGAMVLEPQMLGLLSPYNVGDVTPGILAGVAEWTSQQAAGSVGRPAAQ